MPFVKGKPKTGGRQVGRPNKITGAFREAVQYVYDDIGGHKAFSKWAKQNETEFYRIASRLIPVEIRETSDNKITITINRSAPPPAPAMIVDQSRSDVDGIERP
jgi:hypothetical protein